MKSIRNVSGRAREIADTGQRVEPDASVEVDDALAKSLLEQPANWAAVTTKPKKEN